MSQESKDHERYRSALRKVGIVFVPRPNDLEHIHSIIPQLKKPFTCIPRTYLKLAHTLFISIC